MERIQKVRLKIARANEHIRDLESRISLWKPNAYSFIPEDDPYTHDRLYKFRLFTPIPPEWGTIIGDAIHNTRSALDHLIFQLVEANGCTPTTQTGFPIGETLEKYVAMFAAKINGVDPEAAKIINTLTPYRNGNDDLWRIHDLDRIDKHRLLIPVGAVNTDVTWHCVKGELPVNYSPIEQQFPDGLFPLEDGAIVYTLRARSDAAHNYYEPEFSLDIALSDSESPGGDPVLPTLQELSQHVDGVVRCFNRFLM